MFIMLEEVIVDIGLLIKSKLKIKEVILIMDGYCGVKDVKGGDFNG